MARRLDLVQIRVMCPHFERTVQATLNRAIERLVACTESETCRDPSPEDPSRPFPRGCPVYPNATR